jgi:hypothetical protein
MSAFALDFSGDPVPCDFPGCVLDAFHEGEHEFLSQQELNERAAASVTSYGIGTRSYHRSTEKREMERQREIATARYEAAPHKAVEVPLLCRCAQRPYPHELSVHSKIRSEKPGTYTDFYDFVLRFAPKEPMRWPWSLCLSARVEMSTERRQPQ